MPTARQPGPLGVDAFSVSSPASYQPFFLRGSLTQLTSTLYTQLGNDPDQQKNHPSGTKELTVVGDYDNPWNASEEIAALKGNYWSPSTQDFVRLARSGGVKKPPVVDSFDALIYLILTQTKHSIKRINIIAHGDDNGIGFGGSIDKQGGVFFNVDDMLTLDNLRKFLITESTDSYGRTFIHTHLITIGKKTVEFTIDDVREKFGSNAEIAVFACSVGASTELLKLLAKVLQVKVLGFNNELDYYIEYQGKLVNRNSLVVAEHEPKSDEEKNKKKLNTAETKGVKSFRELKFSVTVRPKTLSTD